MLKKYWQLSDKPEIPRRHLGYERGDSLPRRKWLGNHGALFGEQGCDVAIIRDERSGRSEPKPPGCRQLEQLELGTADRGRAIDPSRSDTLETAKKDMRELVPGQLGLLGVEVLDVRRSDPPQPNRGRRADLPALPLPAGNPRTWGYIDNSRSQVRAIDSPRHRPTPSQSLFDKVRVSALRLVNDENVDGVHAFSERAQLPNWFLRHATGSPALG